MSFTFDDMILKLKNNKHIEIHKYFDIRNGKEENDVFSKDPEVLKHFWNTTGRIFVGGLTHTFSKRMVNSMND